jgi:hypothetical protein
MPQSKEEFFNAFVQWVTQDGWGFIHRRDPRQAVPPDCAFIRVRCPGEVLFTSVGMVQFRTQEAGVTACQMFAEAHALAQSRLVSVATRPARLVAHVVAPGAEGRADDGTQGAARDSVIAT